MGGREQRLKRRLRGTREQELNLLSDQRRSFFTVPLFTLFLFDLFPFCGQIPRWLSGVKAQQEWSTILDWTEVRCPRKYC